MKTTLNTLALTCLTGVLVFTACQSPEVLIPTNVNANGRLQALPGVEIAPVTGNTWGHSYIDLLQTTSKWTMQVDPLQDPWTDGPNAAIHLAEQPLSDVNILLGNIGGESERWITVSKDKPIYMPVLGLIAFDYVNNTCEHYNPTIARAMFNRLNKYNNRFLNSTKGLQFSINGQSIDIEYYRVNSGMFKSVIHPDAITLYGLCPVNASDEAEMLAEYYGVFLKLAPGTYTITGAGTLLGGLKFYSSSTWHITVL